MSKTFERVEREPRVAAVPERRVRGGCKQLGQPGAQRVRDRDRLLRGLQPDVHVQPEDQLTLDRPLQRLDELLVALLLRYLLVLVARERMRAGGDHGNAARFRLLARATPQLAGLGDRLADRARGLRRDLDRRLEQLGLDALVALRRLAEHLRVARRQLEALAH